MAAGWCAAARNAKGYCAFVLPLGSPDEALALLLEVVPVISEASERFRDIEELVERYYDGWRTDFGKLPLDLSGMTSFRRKVLEIVRAIPYGQVRTYRWIGMEMGRPEATRAIGGAVGANPIPLIIPCHRVIAADGALGGFSAPGGVETKARMLEIERVRLHGSGEQARVLA